MLNIFTLANGRLFQEEIESLEELSKFQPIWVDLESPTLEEKRWIKQYYGLSIPEDAMDEDIEESARFYEEDNGELHIRSDFLIADDEEPRTVRVAFILNLVNDDLKSKGVLFSIHDEDVPVFRLLRMRARRAVSFMMRSKMLNAEQFEEARQILRDIDSLDSHTAFLFDKINFLMDATVGFININQNKIIKIFSVASVALLPPTLIASIYGMNMTFPELQLLGPAAYPYVIALMVASALVPMIYFRKRGWLK